MAMTHSDADAGGPFIKRLRERAVQMTRAGKSTIAAGTPGEDALASWQSHGVHVTQMPDDEQGILRISVGGGTTPVPLNYCTFRGDHARCVDLLRKALRALEDPTP